jgi:tRNA-dihydrouridine synthase
MSGTTVSFAPMEGITNYIFRGVFRKTFGCPDRFYSPFLSPGPVKGLSGRDLKDILPENNRGIHLIPQVLTNRAEDFLKSAELLKSLGYDEINLNLGCPSGTVTAKGKGSGFLKYPAELERFLNAVFAECCLKISVKTRIGVESAEEFPELLKIYNRFPLAELIIHPRVMTDQYRNHVNLQAFALAAEESRNPLCYNGDVRTVADYEMIREKFPSVGHIMIGRGFLTDPNLVRKISEAENSAVNTSCGREAENAKTAAFLESLLAEYEKAYGSENAVLCRMKEIWFYLSQGYPEEEKQYKRIKKAKTLEEYGAASHAILKV